jgi:hypothetical protein
VVRMRRSPTSGEWEQYEPEPVPPETLEGGTLVGVERGPERAIPSHGFAPVIPNDAWESAIPDHTPTRWCIRRGGLLPRLHRPEHFLIFDPTIPRYRRCARCGQTIYLYKLRG